MNRPTSLVLPVFFALTLVATAATAPAPASVSATQAKAADQAARTQQHIDVLLKRRLKPDPLPVTLPNPFQVVSGSAIRRPDGTIEEPPEADDTAAAAAPAEEATAEGSAEALTRYAARLKIGGLIRLNGQPQLIINDSPRKEGDFIIVEHKEAVTYLQIVKIAPGALTLRLNEAVQTIKF